MSIPIINLLPQFQPIGTGNPDVAPGSPELSIGPLQFAPGTTDTPVSGPNARTISNVVSGGQSADGENADTNDPTGTSAWQYAFGQFIDHDLDLENTPANGAPINITIPANDPTLTPGSQILLTRAQVDPTTGTSVNTVAGDLDLSQIYGSDPTTAASLRNPDGTLKTSAGDNLPIVNGAFVSGDVRVDENPELTAISKLFVNEHNYWVGVLKDQHPDWTGDQLYNMAKAITTAEYQNIIYTEYLPTVLGAAATPQFTGYNPAINPQVTEQFSDGAFRFGHSEVSNGQQGIDNNGNVLFTQTLADSFFNTPAIDEANGASSASALDGLNSIIRDLSNDNSQAVDVYAVDGLRNLLADSPDEMDLIAIDIQRERDVGVGTLNETRIALGLAPYTSFAQLTSDPTVAANLASVYGNINNLDLFIGGLAENHAPGADVGQTFQAIIADQFSRLENGNQFFWMNEGFSPAVQQMISQTTLADIIERNTGTPAEQPNVFIEAQRVASNDLASTDPTMPVLVIGVNTPGATIAGNAQDNNTIVAGDTISHQILTGGGGNNDVFQFDYSHQHDTITDWNATDTLQFQGNFADNATVDVTDFNRGTKIKFDGSTITLPGIAASSLTANNFLFPPTGSPGILVNGNPLTMAATNITGGCSGNVTSGCGFNVTNGCDGTT
jgi:peroxidase